MSVDTPAPPTVWDILAGTAPPPPIPPLSEEARLVVERLRADRPDLAGIAESAFGVVRMLAVFLDPDAPPARELLAVVDVLEHQEAHAVLQILHRLRAVTATARAVGSASCDIWTADRVVFVRLETESAASAAMTAGFLQRLVKGAFDDAP